MPRHNVVLQAQLDRRIAQVDQLQHQVAQEQGITAARDSEIAALKVRLQWRRQTVEIGLLAFGTCIGFFSGFLIFKVWS